MKRFLPAFLQRFFLVDQSLTLRQWQENSFRFVIAAICITALPALVRSTFAAIEDGLWFNLIAYHLSYLFCLTLAFTQPIPFKIRAWAGVMIFFGLGSLSLFSTGPIGSARIWLYTTSVFATLILGIRSGLIVLCGQCIILTIFQYLLNQDFNAWIHLELHTSDTWMTTSVTLMFLSMISVIAMARLIQGIAYSLGHAQETSRLLQDTATQLEEKVKAHDRTILSLKESEERWHFALEGAGDGVWDWDLQTGRVFFSSQWKRMFGYEAHDIQDHIDEWLDRVSEEERPRLQSDLYQNIRPDRPYFMNRHRIRCKDGSFRWVVARGKLLQWDDQNGPLRILGTHTDVTTIKTLEKKQIEYESRLQQAQKMEAIGTLAGGIAHDFNNILFPILGFTEMLMEDKKEADTATRESLNQIHASALRAKELVHQILAFSRQDDVDHHPIRFQIILKEAVKLLRSTIPRHIEIKNSLNKDCSPIHADATQLHQIIMNLTTNAFHAIGDDPGEIRITLDEAAITPDDLQDHGLTPGSYVCLTIADTGKGIPPEIIDKIFDPFFTTKKKGKGTGMGLSVTHGIVKKMNGSIRVKSEPGEGTEFRVYIPVLDALSTVRQAPDPENPEPFAGDEHILLVDDEEAILDMQKKALNRLGYQTSEFSDPEAAITQFCQSPDRFDLVITDLSMPGIRGDKLVKELHRIRGDIPVIMSTGFSEEITLAHAKEIGFADMVMKPILVRDLCAKIRNIFDHPGS
ncbi:MAG: response regulator [Desulfobacteraceae bacterium]|nr:MAG: response regulator [Desulfobacteraceae bacterium]